MSKFNFSAVPPRQRFFPATIRAVTAVLEHRALQAGSPVWPLARAQPAKRKRCLAMSEVQEAAYVAALDEIETKSQRRAAAKAAGVVPVGYRPGSAAARKAAGMRPPAWGTGARSGWTDAPVWGRTKKW